MKRVTNNREKTKKMVLLALFTAMVAVLAYLGGFIKIGGIASINLTLIPVVIGAALCGAGAGAWLGAVSGLIFFATADAAFWFGLSIPGTIITVLAKGILAGFFAGVTYRLLERVNRYFAVLISAMVAPIVNTAVFLLGCVAFFFDYVQSSAAEQGSSMLIYMMVFFVGLNFVFELLANLVLSPAILRVINLKKR